jgi:hypothetical protein
MESVIVDLGFVGNRTRYGVPSSTDYVGTSSWILESKSQHCSNSIPMRFLEYILAIATVVDRQS